MSQTPDTGVNQYLTLTLGQELFAVGIGSVREVLDLVGITRVPRAPSSIRGVINLRGRAVPVVDPRRIFDLPATGGDTQDTRIIIVEVPFEGETAILGVLADSVEEVFELDPDGIEPAPPLGTAISAAFIRGLAKWGERFLMILDIEKVFASGASGALPTGGDGLAASGEG